MPQFRANKARVPVASDAYSLTADLAAMADSLNLVIPVASDTERNALPKYTGMVVTRTDMGGKLQIWDGAAWQTVRYDNPDNQMVFTNSGFAWSANTAWDAGTLSKDTSTNASSQVSPLATDFATNGSLSGTLKFLQPGIYDIDWYVKPGSDPGASGYSIVTSGTWPTIGGGYEIIRRQQRAAASGTPPYYWETNVQAINLRVPQANLQIRFTGQQSNATTNVAEIKVYQKAAF